MSYVPHDAIVVRPGQDLTALVAALPASNVRIYLADGTHTLSGTLVLSGKSNWSIEGGPNAVVTINAPASQTMAQLINCSDVTFQGFRLSATACVRIFEVDTITRIRFLNLNVSHTNGFATGRFISVVFGSVGGITDVTIRGCVFSGVFDEVFSISAIGVSISRLKMSGNQLSSSTAFTALANIASAAAFSDSIFSDNTVSTAGQVIACSIACTNIIVRNNIVASGGLGGFGFGVPTRLIIEGNTVAACTVGGLVLNGGVDVVVRNNCFTGGTGWMITGYQLNRFTFTGNKLISGGTAGFDAIRIYDCQNGVISANVIGNFGRYGIQFTGAGGNSDIIVDANEFRTNANSDIVFATVPSLRVIVSNNQFYRNVAGDAVSVLAAATFTDGVIRGNTFDLPAANAIGLASATRVNVQSNIIRAPVASGIRLDSCTFCTVNDNQVDAAGANGLRIDNCADIVVDGNRFATAGATHAIDCLNACPRIIINANRLVTVGGNGVNTANLDYSVIRSNKITGCAVGVYISAGSDNNIVGSNEIQSPTSHGIHSLGEFVNIVGNKVIGAGGNGILVAEDNTLVGGNTCAGCTGDGIRVDGGGVAVANVNINGNYCGGNSGDGINLVDCDESLVQSNRCYNNSGYGVNQDANSDQCLVSSNHVRGNVTGALNLLGTNLTSVNNKT